MERSFGTLTLRIDPNLCVGFGDCLDPAGGVLELDDDGVVSFRDGAPSIGEAVLRAVCEACPVDALTLLDHTGRQLAP